VTWQDWCDFAQNKYNILRKNYDKFFVSGLCLGAAMAVYLGEHNKDLTGIIALSTTLFLDGFCIPWTISLLPFALSTIVRFYYTFPEDDCFGVKNERTRKSLAKITAKANISMDNYPLNCVDGLLKLSKNVRKNLKNVTCPVLCIHSKYDNLSSPKSAKVVLDGISSEIKQYVELNDSYHMILYDNEKEFVMNTVKEFLNKFVPVENEKEVVCI
jgi:carboxylesterase